MTQAPPPLPPSSPPPPPAGYGGPGPQKSGTPVWVWIAGGCLVLLLLGVGACVVGGLILGKKAADFGRDLSENPARAAELLVKLNPEIELVESDEDAGTITIREKSTGKVTTLDFDELKEGRFSFETEDGESTIDFSGAGEDGTIQVDTPEGRTRIGAGGLDDVPEWVLLHPDGAETQAMMTTAGANGASGMLSQKVSGTDRDEAMSWFQGELEADGWEVNTTRMEASGQDPVGNVTAEKDGRTLNVTVTGQSGGDVQLLITYDGR